MNKKIEKEFVSNTFFRRENNSRHSPYEQELMFFQAVKDGNMEYIEKNLTPLSNEHLGELSKDSLRNLQYHLVITIALITRFCIEGGMDYEAAYTLSDIYIQKADLCKSNSEENRFPIPYYLIDGFAKYECNERISNQISKRLSDHQSIENIIARNR